MCGYGCGCVCGCVFVCLSDIDTILKMLKKKKKKKIVNQQSVSAKKKGQSISYDALIVGKVRLWMTRCMWMSWC